MHPPLGLLNEALFDINQKYECHGYPGPGNKKGHLRLTMNPIKVDRFKTKIKLIIHFF